MKLRLMAIIWMSAVLGVEGQGTAPDLPYESGSDGRDGALEFRTIPLPLRQNEAVAYDGARQRIVLFGGSPTASAATFLDDTWLFDGRDWVQASGALRPPARRDHRLVWDAARQEVVLFGGVGFGGASLDDTWVWNGTAWSERHPVTRPTPRAGFGMAFDASRNQVVLFGGAGATGNQTWSWDGNNWSQLQPVASPISGTVFAMGYDPRTEQVVLLGGGGTLFWTWDGSTWSSVNPAHRLSVATEQSMVTDPRDKKLVIFQSFADRVEVWRWDATDWTRLPRTNPAGAPDPKLLRVNAVFDSARNLAVVVGSTDPLGDTDTWTWAEGDWAFHSGRFQNYPLSVKPDGVFRFTSIHIPPGVTVRFPRNQANTPVRLLAQQDVVVEGTLDLSGQVGRVDPSGSLPVTDPTFAGPGGFDGGLRGLQRNASGTYSGGAGQGPGGGAPGTVSGQRGTDATHLTAYGNAFIEPLIGGSGGGGGASTDIRNGATGGGGGGAILIASSRDIRVTGAILCNGGGQLPGSNGGYGSGGAILLCADRISGDGALEAYGGVTANPNGRIRLEAYLRNFSGTSVPVAVESLPTRRSNLPPVAKLSIVRVEGENVVQPPTGNLQTPDVVFSKQGLVRVTVAGQGLADGTICGLRLNSGGQTQLFPRPGDPLVRMNAGTALFDVPVPAGLGTFQASAEVR